MTTAQWVRQEVARMNYDERWLRSRIEERASRRRMAVWVVRVMVAGVLLGAAWTVMP